MPLESNAETKGYPVRLAVFEGPLDLLLHLIDSQQIDIHAIPIAEITEQFIAFITADEDLDLEAASEFIIMAATLMMIKARMLLPRRVAEETEEEQDLRAELVDRLVEYRRIKQAAEVLRQMEAAAGRLFRRGRFEKVARFPDPGSLQGVDVSRLAGILSQVLASVSEQVHHVSSKRISFRLKMVQVLRNLHRAGGPVSFRALLSDASDRLEVVVTFLVVLELVRQGRICFRQDEPFGDIMLHLEERW